MDLFLEILFLWGLFSSDKHFIHLHNILIMCSLPCKKVDPCKDQGQLYWKLSHVVIQSQLLVSITWNHVQSSSTYWPTQVFYGFSKQRGKWYELPVHRNRAHHPFLPTRSRKVIRFLRWREGVLTKWGSGRGSSWSGSFQGDTTSCSFAFRGGLWSWLFEWLASNYN